MVTFKVPPLRNDGIFFFNRASVHFVFKGPSLLERNGDGCRQGSGRFIVSQGYVVSYSPVKLHWPHCSSWTINNKLTTACWQNTLTHPTAHISTLIPRSNVFCSGGMTHADTSVWIMKAKTKSGISLCQAEQKKQWPPLRNSTVSNILRLNPATWKAPDFCCAQ